jgi:hypothetical protein
LVLVKVEAEQGFILEVLFLGNVEGGSAGSIKLFGNGIGRVEQVLKEVWLLKVSFFYLKLLIIWTCRDCEIVDASQFSNLPNATEAGSHDNSLVSKLLVIVENVLHTLHAWVFTGRVSLAGAGLVPIENTANEWRNEECTGFSTSDGLDKREHEGEIAVDTMFGLKDLGGLDALVCRGNLDEHAVLGDANLLVELVSVSFSVLRRKSPLTSMMCKAFFTEAWVSNDSLASTSVDTRPGMILRISEPN